MNRGFYIFTPLSLRPRVRHGFTTSFKEDSFVRAGWAGPRLGPVAAAIAFFHSDH
ncbi:hypothetical protein ANO14919_076170 [Xylariales sp. No.14919]|nr:hypothetical protein ANO14919_076170 [Xylariales sp. No.14919]